MITMLLIQSYWDIRYKEIPIIVTIMGAAVGILISFINQRGTEDIILAMIPGGVCLLLGKITKEAIGYGDGWLLCAMGTYLSCEKLLSISMTACMIAGVCALALLVFRKRRGKDTIPFVPFLLVGSVLNYLFEKGIVI